jgi:arginine-tRNA-protein transferase
MYTIRTSIRLFNPNKEQRKDVKKFGRGIGVELTYDSLMNAIKDDEIIIGDMTIKMDSNGFTQEKYELFQKYQKVIHDDEASVKGFKSFLCESPLNEPSSDSKEIDTLPQGTRLGSFHQCYYYKDQLIALAVLDVLPSGLSSVYFIYDPEYKSLSLGKVSALIEMKFSEQLGLDWYYMGYYIQDCHKMRYKSKFGGQLLNPWDMKFVPFHETEGFWCMKDGEDITKSEYGEDGLAFQRGKEAVRDLKQIGIEYKEGKHNLPVVVPGVMELGDIIPLLPTMKLRVELYEVMEVGVLQLVDKYQRVCIDLMRVLGRELFEKCILA